MHFGYDHISWADLDAVVPTAESARGGIVPDERQRRIGVREDALPVGQVRGGLDDIIVTGVAIHAEAENAVGISLRG